MRTRFFSPFLLLFFSPLLALFCAAQARAHGDPIIVTATDGALTTDKPVYVSELEPAGFVLFTDVPGFEFHGFQPGDEMTFDIVDHLWYWNEAQGVTPAADGLELLVEWKTSPFPVVGVSHNPDYIPGNNPLKPGYVFKTIDGQSSEHQHLLAYLFETTELPAGAYGIMLQVKSAGYESTPPFLIAFNEQLSPSAFQEGVGKIGEQAFFVDEPGIPGDFNGDELVDALDIDLLVAHRGADQPDIYDLVPDNIIDDLDAAYWVEQIVGTRFGDVNLDRAIDLADLNAVRNHFGSSGGWATGDFDGSGIVDLPDLNSVRNQFGFVAGSPVPEPGALVLLAISTPRFRRFAAGECRLSGRKKLEKVQKKSRPKLSGGFGRAGELYRFRTGVSFCLFDFATRESGTGFLDRIPDSPSLRDDPSPFLGKLPLPFQNVPLSFRNSLCSASFPARSTQGCTCLFFSTGPDS